MTWCKSSYSNNGQCVEVTQDGNRVLIRNSNHPEAGTVVFTREDMATWILGCKAGEFDDVG